jgi:pimeloyl-ACP methyl ester carboxylesterase
MEKKYVLFLGGMGVPAFIFTPWFALLKWSGYDVKVVPNSFASLDTVSTFAQSFIGLASRYDSFDVLGVSYGGNAALYGLCLDSDICTRIRKMVLVCAPILGVPLLTPSLGRCLPGPFGRVASEMAETSDIVTCIKKLGSDGKITLDLHCIYHERDLMASLRTGTMPGMGVAHKLEFAWNWVPGLMMHQAACVNPHTFKTVLKILRNS